MIKQPQSRWKRGSLALFLFALFALLVVLPLLQFFAASLSADGMTEVRKILRGDPLQQALLRTLAVALLACGLASIVAIPAAFLAVRLSAPVRILIQILGFLPLTMPPFLSAALLRHFVDVLDQTGIANAIDRLRPYDGEIALILVYALHYLPFILFSLIVGLQRIDRSTIESARNLGAGRLSVGMQITLPLLTPAYVLGASVMILRVFEDIGTPLILGIEGMLAPQILLSLGSAGLSDPLLNASALVLMASSVMVATLAWSGISQIPGPQAPDSCIQPLRWRSQVGPLLIHLPLLLVLGILALAPHVWLVLVSLAGTWPIGALPGINGIPDLLRVLATTIRELEPTFLYVIATGILTLLLGTTWAALTRQAGFAGRLARALATAMMAIPGVVLALGFAHAMTLPVLHDHAWPGMAWLALVLVVALKQLPLVEQIIATRMRYLNGGVRDAARNLSAGSITLGLRISLPMQAAMLLAAFLIGCAAAVVELSSALLLLQDASVPLAVDLFRSLQQPSDPATTSAQALLLVSLIAGLLLLLLWMLHQNCYRLTTPPGGPSAANRKTS